MHPDYLLGALSSHQLDEWEAFDKLDPIGTWREDYRMAYIAATVINIVKQLYHEKDKTPVLISVADLMPIWDGERRKQIEEQKQDPEEMKQILLGIVQVHNKRVASVEKLSTRPPTKKNKKTT
jgi:hypothetical protein